MDWIKTGCINALLFGISVGISVLLLDLALFFTQYRFSILPPHEPKDYLVFDSELGYDLAQDAPKKKVTFSDSSFDVWTNSMSCFDDEYTGDKPFMYLTGDSFAWGWAPFEQKWGKVVEKNLSTQVLTCGVNGYGTRQELIKTTRQLAVVGAPSVLLVSYLGANDIDDDATFPNHTVYRGYSVRSDVSCPDGACLLSKPEHTVSKDLKLWLATHSVLYTLLKREVYAPLLSLVRGSDGLRESVVKQGEALPKVHTDAMRGFSKLAEKYDTKLVVMLIPSKDDVRGSGKYTNERMKSFLDEENIAYLDLLSDFKEREKLPEKSLYWTFDGHWNTEGNKLAGLLVAKYLLENNLVSIKNIQERKAEIEIILNRDFTE